MWFCLTFIAIAVSTIYSQEITLAKGFEDHAVKRRVVAGDTLVTVIARVNTNSRTLLQSLGLNVQTIILGPEVNIITTKIPKNEINTLSQHPEIISLVVILAEMQFISKECGDFWQIMPLQEKYLLNYR
ncbi:hypothetical protein H8E88_27980 [candidate division KSB1 bacterium]|nr:hypothetical protein [candidate division KSB1 bacterium]